MKAATASQDMRDDVSASDLDDSSRLRWRFARDGYLFLPRLLDPGTVLDVRRAVLHRLAASEWLRPGTDPDLGLPGDTAHHDSGRVDGRDVVDPGWAVGYRAVQSLEVLHALAHAPALRRVVEALLGPALIVHPRKIARIGFPAFPFPTPPHQDWLFNLPAIDVVTAWIPLGPTATGHGGLQLVPGSAADGPRPAVPADGLGGESVDGDSSRWEWATTDYEPGDVVLFHGFTIHATGMNGGERVRLSMDCRYQSAEEPIRPVALLPHHHAKGVLPGWSTLTTGWATTRWVEVDKPVHVAPVRPTGCRASRLVPLRGATVDDRRES